MCKKGARGGGGGNGGEDMGKRGKIRRKRLGVV